MKGKTLLLFHSREKSELEEVSGEDSGQNFCFCGHFSVHQCSRPRTGVNSSLFKLLWSHFICLEPGRVASEVKTKSEFIKNMNIGVIVLFVVWGTQKKGEERGKMT